MGLVYFHDRTSEFRSIQAQESRRHAAHGNSHKQSRITGGLTAAPLSSRANATEFARSAAEIARGISGTMSKLERLGQLARRQTLFDDRPVEINELTFVIKQELSTLNSRIQNLQPVLKSRHSSQDQAGEHKKAVVYLLQGELGQASEAFRDVLEARTKNIQNTRARTDDFMASVSGQAHVPIKPSLSPFYSTSSNQPLAGAGDDPLSLNPIGEQQALLEEQPSSYIQERREAMEVIERTMTELGRIFTQLAQIVAEQGEQIQRIDANTEEAVDNIDGAQRELSKYWARMSSNRWLIAKFMGIVMIFFLLWVLIAG